MDPEEPRRGGPILHRSRLPQQAVVSLLGRSGPWRSLSSCGRRRGVSRADRL